jgi:uncharacterized HAD superfamily protein
MRIGIDCDGVLTDMSAYIEFYGEKFFRRKPYNLSGYSAKDVFMCNNIEYILFGLFYFPIYCIKWPPRDGAVEIINRLHSNGYKIYEITARKFVTKKSLIGWYSRKMLFNWFNHYAFQLDGIYLCSEEHSPEDKLLGCRKYDVDLMIDDKPDVAIHLADDGIKVLLFDTIYNQNVEHPNIIRVYNWHEIEGIIVSIKEYYYGI